MNVQHTYRIRHRGIESTPHTITDLRQMWKAGQIDATTEFRRGDSPVWLDANDLLSELEFDATPAPASKAYPSTETTTAGLQASINAASKTVRVTSVRIPFGEVFVLVFKFYAAAILLATLVAVVWLAIVRFVR